MPKVSITNRTQAPQGFYAGREIMHVAPGVPRELIMSPEEFDAVKFAFNGGIIDFKVLDDNATPGAAPSLNQMGDRIQLETEARNLDDGVRAATTQNDPALSNAVVQENVDGEGGGPRIVGGVPYPTDAYPLESFTPAELSAHIAQETGQRPHPNTSAENLLKKAKALAGDGEAV